MRIRKRVVAVEIQKGCAHGANAITMASRTVAPLSVSRIRRAIVVNATAAAESSKHIRRRPTRALLVFELTG